MDSLLSDLQTLIRQPSVSARNQGLIQCANLVSKIMDKAGINSKLLYLDSENNNNEEIEIPPIVYGEVISQSNPNGKTILFYNHYDVQPEDPIELWDDTPFSGKVEGNYIFGRGASDDKGELITRIKAVEYYLKETGDVPCNVKFIVEGEEEIGSIHLENYLYKYKEKFVSDGIIWEFGYIDTKDRPIISLGVKGLLYTELTAKGPSRDLHSSLAVLVENPAWRLVQALSTLRNSSGKILIKDWYKDVKEFAPEELALLSNKPFDEDEFKNEYGIDDFLNNVHGKEIGRALVGMPTCNIAGFEAGYTGKGAKTVLPSVARAKLDFRLVLNMLPAKQIERLKNHLIQLGFEDIEVNLIHSVPAARTPVNDPFVKIVETAAREIFGNSIIDLSSAATGPMHSFMKILECPSISIGSTHSFSRIHSPNEYARIDLLNKATKCFVNIIEKFAA